MSIPGIPGGFGRAIDLSSLGKPKIERPTSNFPEVTVENLMADFVQRSRELPVVLLAYSERSPASIQIRDLMASMAQSDNGSWKFGAILAESQPELIQALQVQSVPYAIAFIAEQAVPLFDRPVQEEQIRLILSKLFELARERGLKVDLPEAKEAPLEPEEAAAIAALESGDYSGAAMAYRNWLQRKPDEEIAKIGLAQCELMIRIEGKDPARTISEGDQDPTSLTKQIAASDIEVAQGMNQRAFDRLITFIRSASGDEKKVAKEHLLSLFSLVDPADPVVIKARQSLASALF